MVPWLNTVPGEYIFTALFNTLRKAIRKVWDFHLGNLEIDLEGLTTATGTLDGLRPNL